MYVYMYVCMYVCMYLCIYKCVIIVTDCSEEEGVAVQLDERESWKGRQEKGVWATGRHRVQKGQQISMRHNKKIIERRRTVGCMYVVYSIYNTSTKNQSCSL